MVLELERIEHIPANFRFSAVHIRKPSYCRFEEFKKEKVIVIYPITKQMHVKDLDKNSVLIKNIFTISKLHWVRHVKDDLMGNIVTLVITHRNYRRQHVSYRLRGYCDGRLFDITPYFRHFYRRYIPAEIPTEDIVHHDKVSMNDI